VGDWVARILVEEKDAQLEFARTRRHHSNSSLLPKIEKQYNNANDNGSEATDQERPFLCRLFRAFLKLCAQPNETHADAEH
jgi:hypothetical protein